MKRLKVCGFVIGLFVGVFASGFFWMVSMLPGAPSQYGPLFPISDAPIPADAVGKYRPGTVGFDVYTNFKKPPVIRKDDAVPIKRGFSASSAVGIGKQTIFQIHERIWLEYGGNLYKVGQFSKYYPLSITNLVYYTGSNELSVDEFRQLRWRKIISELNIDETFGPFPLP